MTDDFDTDPTGLTADELGRRLTNWATGLGREYEAIALLRVGKYWLEDRDFLRACVFLIDSDDAAIDWLAIPEFLRKRRRSAHEAEVLEQAFALAQRRR